MTEEKKRRGRQRKLTPQMVLGALTPSGEAGSGVAELADRLGFNAIAVEELLRELVVRRLVLLMPPKMDGSTRLRMYRVTTRWEQASPRRVTQGEMKGYTAWLLGVWQMSDSIHSRTDPRQLCTFGLREASIEAESRHD
jgi:hypothetical protein